MTFIKFKNKTGRYGGSSANLTYIFHCFLHLFFISIIHLLALMSYEFYKHRVSGYLYLGRSSGFEQKKLRYIIDLRYLVIFKILHAGLKQLYVKWHNIDCKDRIINGIFRNTIYTKWGRQIQNEEFKMSKNEIKRGPLSNSV